MKRTILSLVLMLAGSLTACAGPSVYATFGPPAPPVYHARPLAPGPGYCWIEGHQRWTGQGYVWMPGYWARIPRGHRVWVTGYWHEHHPGHWAYVQGYWR